MVFLFVMMFIWRPYKYDIRVSFDDITSMHFLLAELLRSSVLSVILQRNWIFLLGKRHHRSLQILFWVHWIVVDTSITLITWLWAVDLPLTFFIRMMEYWIIAILIFVSITIYYSLAFWCRLCLLGVRATPLNPIQIALWNVQLAFIH